jgi:hypothetical protein
MRKNHLSADTAKTMNSGEGVTTSNTITEDPSCASACSEVEGHAVSSTRSGGPGSSHAVTPKGNMVTIKSPPDTRHLVRFHHFSPCE